MSHLIFSDGLLHAKGYGLKRVPVFLDNNFHLLEAPTRWSAAQSKKGYRSLNTRRAYGYKLHKFLNWLDEVEIGSQNWAVVDEEILDEYLLYLCERDDDEEPAEHDTVEYYAARVMEFYDWAEAQGLHHNLEIERKTVEIKLTNQLMLAHVRSSVKVMKLGFNLPTGRPALLHREIAKFVTRDDYVVALKVLIAIDPVYAVIAYVLGSTALRPKELFQVPYRGRGANRGFVDYNYDNIPDDLTKKSISLDLDSKGKRRVFEFPGRVWQWLCENYIPLRRERAENYKKRYGIYPPNDALFLAANGDIVTYRMLSHNFGSVIDRAQAMRLEYKGQAFTAKMLRHMFATYFVYEALKKRGRLGQPYVYDAALDDQLRRWMGHESVETTYEYYVHLVNRFVGGELIADIANSNIDGLSEAISEVFNAKEWA